MPDTAALATLLQELAPSAEDAKRRDVGLSGSIAIKYRFQQ